MIEKSNVAMLSQEFLSNSDDYLVDVSIAPVNIITVEIDNDNGVNIDRCIELSRFLETKLDREMEDFELTVTSFGLTSPFKTPRQYKKHIGKEVETLTKKGIKLKGILKAADEEGFRIVFKKTMKPEGAKRKIEIEEDSYFTYEEIKYTKYLIRF